MKPKTRRNVMLDDETRIALQQLGNGNVSKGIREAVRLVNVVIQNKPCQRTTEDEKPTSAL